jgi:hypothetical protein
LGSSARQETFPQAQAPDFTGSDAAAFCFEETGTYQSVFLERSKAAPEPFKAPVSP